MMNEYLVIWQETLGGDSAYTLSRTVFATRSDEAWNILVRSGAIKTEDTVNGRVMLVESLWQPEIVMKPQKVRM